MHKLIGVCVVLGVLLGGSLAAPNKELAKDFERLSSEDSDGLIARSNDRARKILEGILGEEWNDPKFVLYVDSLLDPDRIKHVIYWAQDFSRDNRLTVAQSIEDNLAADCEKLTEKYGEIFSRTEHKFDEDRDNASLYKDFYQAANTFHLCIIIVKEAAEISDKATWGHIKGRD